MNEAKENMSNEQQHQQPSLVWLPRNEEEQAALSAAFAQDRTRFSLDERQDKFEKPKDQLAGLQEGPLLTLVRESSIPDPEKNNGEHKIRGTINDKDRARGLPYHNFSVWRLEQNGEETLIADGEGTEPDRRMLGNDILELNVLERLKPYFSSTLNQHALNGFLIRYLVGSLSYYLPRISWTNVLGGSTVIAQKTGLKILRVGENQFQLTFTQLGFKKDETSIDEEYSDTTFSVTLNLTFSSAEAEMPSEVTLSNVELSPFSRELSNAIDAQRVLERKLNDTPFVAGKLSNPIYCHSITTFIFIGKITLNKILRVATPQQKIDLLKNIFNREEFSEWFLQLPESEQDDLLQKSHALPISEKIVIFKNLLDPRVEKAKNAFSQDIGWNTTTENMDGLSAEELRIVASFDEDPQHRVLTKIIDDAQKPRESYNFFEKRFPRLFQKKHKQNQDIVEKKNALRLLLSRALYPNNTSKEAHTYLTDENNKKKLAEAFLSDLTLLEKLNAYNLGNDLLRREIVDPIKDSEDFSTASVSDLLRAGVTDRELTTFAKFKSGASPATTLNETTEAIIKGASKKTKTLNFFEKKLPRLFSRKARENKEIKVQLDALSTLVSSDKNLAREIQAKIYSNDVTLSDKFVYLDAISKFKPEREALQNNQDYIENLKCQAEMLFHQAYPEGNFANQYESFIKMPEKFIPFMHFFDLTPKDALGSTHDEKHEFFSGMYKLFCMPADTLPAKETFSDSATVENCCKAIRDRISQISQLLAALKIATETSNMLREEKNRTFLNAYLDNRISLRSYLDLAPVPNQPNDENTKRAIIDHILNDENKNSDLAQLALLPNDPYGARAYIEEKSHPGLGTRFLRKLFWWTDAAKKATQLTELARTVQTSVYAPSEVPVFARQPLPNTEEEEAQQVTHHTSDSTQKILAGLPPSRENSPRSSRSSNASTPRSSDEDDSEDLEKAWGDLAEKTPTKDSRSARENAQLRAESSAQKIRERVPTHPNNQVSSGHTDTDRREQGAQRQLFSGMGQ